MPSLFYLILYCCCLVGAVTAAATFNDAHAVTTVPQKCKSLRARLEWRAMKPRQKKDYVDAVKCLQQIPAANKTSVIQTRFDELVSSHIDFADRVHSVGQFLPWHRGLLIIYERFIRNECHYKGPIPYWDWSKDADRLTHMANSSIFDPATGFGGDGVAGTYSLPENYTLVPSRVPINPYAWKGCVKDGPFAAHPIVLGPGKLVTKHCLVRDINDTYKEYLTTNAVRNATIQPSFELFRIELEGRPVTPTPKMHDAAHVLVGGDMSNFYSSVADPLFILHHANLDRIWWVWQQIKPAKRLYEITGRSTVAPPYTDVTLDFDLDFGALAPSLKIRQVMNIHEAPACYTYV